MLAGEHDPCAVELSCPQQKGADGDGRSDLPQCRSRERRQTGEVLLAELDVPSTAGAGVEGESTLRCCDQRRVAQRVGDANGLAS